MTEKAFTDFLNRNITIGDYVVFPAPYGQGLKLGKIVKFTPKNMRVSWARKDYRGNVTNEETIRQVKECVKVEGPELTMFLLSGEY
jgi:hypothetical protein